MKESWIFLIESSTDKNTLLLTEWNYKTDVQINHYISLINSSEPDTILRMRSANEITIAVDSFIHDGVFYLLAFKDTYFSVYTKQEGFFAEVFYRFHNCNGIKATPSVHNNTDLFIICNRTVQIWEWLNYRFDPKVNLNFESDVYKVLTLEDEFMEAKKVYVQTEDFLYENMYFGSQTDYTSYKYQITGETIKIFTIGPYAYVISVSDSSITVYSIEHGINIMKIHPLDVDCEQPILNVHLTRPIHYGATLSVACRGRSKSLQFYHIWLRLKSKLQLFSSNKIRYRQLIINYRRLISNFEYQNLHSIKDKNELRNTLLNSN